MVEVEKSRITSVTINLSDCERVQLRTVLMEATERGIVLSEMELFIDNLAVQLHEEGDPK